MKVKEMIIDFISYIFLLLIIIFSIIYFIAGDRLESFGKFLHAFIPFSYFCLIFILKFKAFNKKYQDYKYYKQERNLDEIIIYFTRFDLIRNIFFIILSSIFVILIAIYNQTVNLNDFIQSLLAFVVLLFSHILLFHRKKDAVVDTYATVLDKMIQELIIFILPVIIYLPAFGQNDSKIIDVVQSLSAFLIMYFWNKFLFKNVTY